MLGFISKIFGGNKSQRDIASVQPIVSEILEYYSRLQDLSNDELRDQTKKFQQLIKNAVADDEFQIEKYKKKIAETPTMHIAEVELIYKEIDALKKKNKETIQKELDQILPEAFAVLKETSRRFKENEEIQVIASAFDIKLAETKDFVEIEGDKAIYFNSWEAAGTTVKWDMVHYDVQLIGGIVLHQGKIAEMATGEGKTLVATLPIYLNALSGKGLHVVTVNNYLAKRDSEWMGPIFMFHGLTIDCIDMHEPNSEERRQAYLADITYGTNNEFGFDYLRDNMARSPEDMVQREHNYAIVDEVDSVLVDDARTPLIISGPTGKSDSQEFQELKPRVERLVNAQRAVFNDVLTKAKKLISEGNTSTDVDGGGFLLLRAHRALPKNKALIKYLSESGNKALLQKTEGVYMQDHGKEMVKIDAELYFTIDEKNNSTELTEKGIDLISSSAEDAKFFILPDIGLEIAEMEKSALSDNEKLVKKDELIRDYSIKAERVHTINQLLKAYSLFEIDVEYVVMDNKIKIVDEQTGRILDGRRYSDGLHQAIEAKENVKIEAATQTFATITLQNYFRMFNKLAGMTGTAETEAGEFWDIYKLDVVVIPTNRIIQRNDGEDLVYKTKREKYNAAIDKVVEETTKGRPVLVGTTSVEISELLSKMLKMRNIKHNVLNAKQHQKEADIVQEAGQAGTVTIATNMAGRGTDIKLGPGVKEAGGLAIVGTERHDSRRVDRQLRGRAGRQGDPGSSQFFVSLEDDLMRLFGSDRIAGWMDRMGLKEGEVIQHSMITKSIERAQKKVEENNFGIRKRLLEYDDVMNSQREVIYSKRRHALFGDKLAVDISNSMYDVSENITVEFKDVKDFDGFKFELIKVLGIESPFSEKEFYDLKNEEIISTLFEKATKHYQEKSGLIMQSSFPIIKDVYDNSAHLYENIVVPFTDGIKTVQVLANLKKSYETNGREIFTAFEKNVPLAIIDDAWKEHLRELDDLKQSVQNAVYEQKDPLLIYKFESFELFKQMIMQVNKEIVSFLMKATLPQENASEVKEVKEAPKVDMSKLQVSRTDATSTGGMLEEIQKPKQQPVTAEKTVGRNDLCPCGSGKKFKQCHGK